MYEEMFETNKVVPVVVLKELSDTLPTLSAMCRGGVTVAEITFRTACAAEAIALGRKELPDMTIGAGTVINGEQCERAIAAGAQFIVGPGISEEVAAVCKAHEIPYFPGCVPPTEIMKALSLGYNIIKFFPAGVFGGLKALKALSGPFPQVKFLPTGGADLSNLEEYLAFDKIIAVGGSWMMKGDVEQNCRAITDLLKK